MAGVKRKSDTGDRAANGDTKAKKIKAESFADAKQKTYGKSRLRCARNECQLTRCSRPLRSRSAQEEKRAQEGTTARKAECPPNRRRKEDLGETTIKDEYPV